MHTHTLPDLPYELDALEPHISSETLQYHYKKHHAGYVDKLNGLVKGTSLEGSSLEDIILKESPGKVFNNAAQIWNHTFYWNSMTPKSDSLPSPGLVDEINGNFGSLEKFKQEFAEVATGQFGSGWAWLVSDKSGKLKITSTANADIPVKQGLTPLAVCDVWEHAYYIDYRNDRGMYVDKFLTVLNWKFIEDNLGNSENEAITDHKAVGMS